MQSADNAQSLSSFHTTTSVRSSRIRIIIAAIFALLVGAAGFYTYQIGMWDPKPQPMVPDDRLPSPSPLIPPPRN